MVVLAAGVMEAVGRVAVAVAVAEMEGVETAEEVKAPVTLAVGVMVEEAAEEGVTEEVVMVAGASVGVAREAVGRAVAVMVAVD